MFLMSSLCIVVIFGFGFYLSRNSRKNKLSSALPGPYNFPILGSAHEFIMAPPNKYLKILSGFIEKYGSFCRIWIGNDLHVIMLDPHGLEVVMSKMNYHEKSDEYRYLKNWLTDGLLISKGAKWFRRRKIITPAFHFKILEDYASLFEEQSRKLCKLLKKTASGELVDLHEWISRYTLDVISETAMGVTVNAQTDVDSEYVKAVKTISTVLHKRMFILIYRYDFFYQFTALAREERKALKILHGFTEKVILQRREQLLQARSNPPQDNTDQSNHKRRLNFLDILLQTEVEGQSLTNLDIREEVDTFLFEGHDTTSSAVTFCLYNLARYPVAQEKCYKEICRILGTNKETAITYDDLNKFHYIELCIKESLRLFPSVPIFGRKATKDIEINGKVIPAGASIIVSPYLLGRMESLYANANEFIPERFDVVASVEKTNPFAYIPFSAGPRNCVGQKFAMLEVKNVVINVLRNFVVEVVEKEPAESKLEAALILRTSEPILFKLKNRE